VDIFLKETFNERTAGGTVIEVALLTKSVVPAKPLLFRVRVELHFEFDSNFPFGRNCRK
jgi:hypothetical protein